MAHCQGNFPKSSEFVLSREGFGPQIVGGLGGGPLLAVRPHGELTGPACGLIAGRAETVLVDDLGVWFSAFWASHCLNLLVAL